VLTVDEGRAQTRAIHALQREGQTLEGLLLREDRKQIRAVHRNAQRLIRPLFVVNPYARELTFVDHATRTRRDHMKYLTLIRAIALLHQYQRPIRATEHEGKTVQYIEATREDIEVAGRLARSVLSRDELPPQTRRLLGLVEQLVEERARALGVAKSVVRFTRREVREHTKWGHTQVQVHLRRLEELEYVERGNRGQTIAYELTYDSHLSGVAGHLSVPNRVGVGPESGEYRGHAPARNGLEKKAIAHVNGVEHGTAHRAHALGKSYVDEAG